MLSDDVDSNEDVLSRSSDISDEHHNFETDVLDHLRDLPSGILDKIEDELPHIDKQVVN